MKIAVEGCAHGDLDTIYNTLKCLEDREGIKIDLLICCGDFQSSRNEADVRCMAAPQKYMKICSFYKYYNGEKEAPILTIFIGGNHEASNYLQELPYGGWVAPNIYYMGYAGVINVGGIRIGGLSGIYKGGDYMRGHFERSPYSDSTKRSVYHVRNVEVFRLKQLREPLDIFLSHEWPTGIYNYGDREQLVRFKPYLKDDIDSGELGSKPCEELLHELQPDYWFAAHLHCKFAALVPHDNDNKVTKFLALDKCLPRRRFMQVLDISPSRLNDANGVNLVPPQISYDVEWLTILFLTNHLSSVKSSMGFMPGPNNANERWQFQATAEERALVLAKMQDDLIIPKNFVRTAPGHSSTNSSKFFDDTIKQPDVKLNPQTIAFCKRLDIDDPLCLLLNIDDEMASSLIMDDSALLDDDDNDRTFVSDSDVSLNRSSLILPEPVNGNQDDEDAGYSPQKGAVEDGSAVVGIEAAEKSMESDHGDGGVIAESLNDDGLDSTSSAVTNYEIPSNKKFKRRNADIYQNDDL